MKKLEFLKKQRNKIMKKEYLDKDITVFQFLKKRFLINEVDKKWLIISDKIYFLLKKYAKDKFYEKE